MRRLGLALLVAAAGCSPNRGEAYTRALADADRAESAGHFAEAASHYDQAAATAKIARDRDHVRYLAALMLERSGDHSGADARLLSIANASPPLEDSASAEYEEAEMRLTDGDGASGWRAIDAMLRRFPNDGLARPALHRTLKHLDETEGDTKTIAYLRSLEPSLGKTERGEEIAYEIALRLARLGQAQAARDAFVSVADRWPYPRGALFDNSLYRASELDEGLGRYAEAVGDLVKMLAPRESSVFIGSYERPLYDVAQMRIADLYEGHLHDRVHAKEALHKLYEAFPTSLLRDRALWKEAELWEQDGDRASSCDRLRSLVHDFPDSRYVPCATERCPSVTRATGSKAPTTCRAYIEREEHKETEAPAPAP